MTDSKILTISLFCSRKSLDMTVPKAIEWLQDLLAEIPEEYRDSSTFSVELDYGVYDDPTELDVQVYYNRKETPKEADERAIEEAQRKESARLSEIARMRDNIARLESQVRQR